MATNFESLLGKIYEFKFRVNELKPDVIFGTETWLKNDINDCFIDIPGFKTFRKDTQEIRGGVIIMVREHIEVELCNEINSLNVKDTLWLWIKRKNCVDDLFGVVYRKGDASDEYNDMILQQFEIASRICKGKILINGDFNLPKIDWVNGFVDDTDSSFSHKFYDKLCDLFFTQHVLEATRQRGNNIPSCLDLVISSNETYVNNVEVLCPIGKADHSVLTWDFQMSNERKCEKDIFRFDYKAADYNKLCQLLAEKDWNIVTNATDVNVAWDFFQNCINDVVNECVPLVKINNGQKINPPWFNAGVKRSVRRKYFAWKRYQECKNYIRYQEYVKQRNAASKKVRAAKKEYEKNLCKRVKKNPKAFYMYVNSKSKSNSQVSKLKVNNDVTIEEDQDIADELNCFFQSVFVKEEDRELIWFNDFMHNIYGDIVSEPFDYNGETPNSVIDNVFFTPEDVLKLLLALNPNKAMGPDEVHPRVLKETASIIYFPLYCILRQSLDQGRLPDVWKLAHVTPIFKKGDKLVTGNYRPVSLTSQVCKICEKLVREGIVQHVNSNDLFRDEQHGFRKGRSCLTNLLVTLEEWTKLYDEGLPIDVLFLDFKKAFDSVPFGRLLYKLHRCGIVGNLHCWLEDFLYDRSQRVCLNGTRSDWKSVTSGVPQGSVIGPILFLLFINDLPGSISAKCKIFADDTKLYHPIVSLTDQAVLQNDIENLMLWSQEWLLGFNENKCKVLHIGHKNPGYNYCMNGIILEEVEEEKDLGVLITKNLSFSKYIAKAAAKANSVLGLIKRTFSYIDKESFLLLYKSYVRPHLEYCVQVWSPHLARDKDVLEKVQRRATKMVPELSHLCYEDRLRELSLTTLEDRRIRGDLIEMYKLLNGLECIDPNLFFKLRNYPGLRGHQLTLETERSRLNVRKHSFSNRSICLWNSLPENIVLSPDVVTFKINYDHYYYNI